MYRQNVYTLTGAVKFLRLKLLKQVLVKFRGIAYGFSWFSDFSFVTKVLSSLREVTFSVKKRETIVFDRRYWCVKVHKPKIPKAKYKIKDNGLLVKNETNSNLSHSSNCYQRITTFGFATRSVFCD
jgi:hypothetical protein